MATDSGLLMEFERLSLSLGADIYSGTNSITGFSSVCIDSRYAQGDSLFVALPGTTCDGHCFVKMAFDRGAAAALVDRKKLDEYDLPALARKTGKALIAVDDTLHGLQEAARIYLEQFPDLIKIGITGSSGKTTTKEIAAAIAGLEKRVAMNPGNYNSETGLPLAVFSVRPEHEVGIFEMGMNHRGEIASLANVLKPNIALITNIGSAHIGILGSKDAIAEEKKQIFSQFTGTETALIPDACAYRDFLADGVNGRVAFYGEESFTGLGGSRSLGLHGSEILWNGQSIAFPLPGKYNLANALAAIAIALEIPVSAAAIKHGLESSKPLFGRGEILAGKATVIQDCYNANPESLEKALEFCESLDWKGRRIYIIGEMLELGADSHSAHEQMGRLLAASKADMVYLFGKETLSAAGVLEAAKVRFFHTCDMGELSGALRSFVQSGDLVLLKGSRGCALERLCDVLAGAA